MKKKKEYKTTHKISLVIILSLAFLILCTGCSQTEVPEAHALTVDSNGKTGTGITVGSSYDEFADAYRSYYVQKIDGENFVPWVFEPVDEKAAQGTASDQAESTDRSDTAGASAASPDHDGAYVVAAFYVDDAPVSIEELTASTGVSAGELADHLSSPEYLAEHTVIYRYIIITIRDDKVSEITSDYLDYNEEL